MEGLSELRHSHTQVANPKPSLDLHPVRVSEQRALEMGAGDLWHHQGRKAGAVGLSGEEVQGARRFYAL